MDINDEGLPGGCYEDVRRTSRQDVCFLVVNFYHWPARKEEHLPAQVTNRSLLRDEDYLLMGERLTFGNDHPSVSDKSSTFLMNRINE